MTALELSGLILTGEFALVSWGILFVMLRRQRQDEQADHDHAGAMREEFASNEVSRRDALETLFASTYNLEGDELSAKVEEYVEREKAFYNAMLSLYLERDGSKLKQIPSELAKVLAPWTQLTPNGMIPASTVGDLEVEKAQLSSELENTKQTLEQLMEEYTAAFARSAGKPEPAAPPPAPAPEPNPEPTPEPAALSPAIAAEPLEIGEDLDEDLDAWAALDKQTGAGIELPAAAERPAESVPSAPEDVLDTVTPAANGDLTHEIGSEGDVDPAPSYAIDQAQDELEGLADLFEMPPGKT